MNPRRRILLAGAGAGAGAALVAALSLAAAPSSAASSKTRVIKAQNIAFTPERLTINRGDRVTWRFLDAKLLSPHTVTSVGAQRFRDSPTGRLTGSFTVRFAKPGTYKFVCTIHPASMTGVITVR